MSWVMVITFAQRIIPTAATLNLHAIPFGFLQLLNQQLLQRLTTLIITITLVIVRLKYLMRERSKFTTSNSFVFANVSADIYLGSHTTNSRPTEWPFELFTPNGTATPVRAPTVICSIWLLLLTNNLCRGGLSYLYETLITFTSFLKYVD